MKNLIASFARLRHMMISCRFVLCFARDCIDVGELVSALAARVAGAARMRYNARSMADELWHYGNLGAIVSVAIWLAKKSFVAGGLVERLESLERDLEEKHAENIRRLERIESLLMERRRTL
jgi:hypothetical protein